ncbi:MAG: TonB-dependent receptor [Cyclobacteriaceae bacterium]|nr:TonB-dependent receptor [Cyclobacteriaceae bacterium]
MKKFYSWSLLSFCLLLAGSTNVWAQATTISGTVKDQAGTPIPGVNVVVKGTVAGTITDVQGNYSLTVKQAPPFTLSFSFVGYQTQEIEVKDGAATTVDVAMQEGTLLGEEVVVSGSRYPESYMKSGVTIEKMDILEIKAAPTPDYYDGLANMKGVQASSGSLNFTAINTRSFATIANVRFVQWVDGMDTQAPLLNFPTGNIIGIGELDAESMELIPGASSALYGPNAFNGILIMKSKSPFEYQGLSAQLKYGMTQQSGLSSNPMTQYSLRYAKAFNNKFAFKINGTIMKAKDWLGNDYKTDRVNPESKTDLSGTNNFDGLNLYGDETQINLQSVLPSLGVITRTGFREEDLVDNREANSYKFDAAIAYKITDKIEASLSYRYGGGSSIYQGTEKYALRDFSQEFIKAEIKGDNFFLRAYQTATDAGKSYNLTALGAYMNETVSPSSSTWVPDYVVAMQGYVPGVPAGTPSAARAFADRNRPVPGTPEFANLISTVKANYFQKTPTGVWYDKSGNPHNAAGGASFFDNSKLYHIEGNYQFREMIKWADIQVGGNWRRYSLFSNGTIFNEAPNDGINFERINIDEYGMYGVIAKSFSKLRATASVRYDKNQNFQGQVTPRLTLVYELTPENNLRASFQTGFRNPDTQAQFIYFPSSGGTLLGSAQANAERYYVHNGGAYTQASYNDFVKAGGSLDPNTGTPINPATNPTASQLLKIANVAYVKPEKLWSGEVGYKGLWLDKKLLLDLNGYYTSYDGFIGGQIVASKNALDPQGNTIKHQGKAVLPGTLFSPYVNSTRAVTSFGAGLGFTYKLPRDFELNGNYNYANYTAEEDKDFRAGFNTPKNRGSVGLSNRKIFKNFGASVNYRYQTAFLWESSYGTWNVPEFGVLDAQVSYTVSKIKSVFKLGATNLGGGDYRTNLGAPYVGQQYYISVTFDEFLK